MIYIYKATLPKSKVFMREYQVDSASSLFEFHQFLLDDLLFSPDQMVLFRGLNKSGKVKSEYGLFDMGDGTLDSVSLKKTIDSGELSLEYVFNMFKDRFLVLTYVGEVEKAPRTSYPRLVAEKGKNPDQFASSYEDLDQFVEENTNAADDDLFLAEELPEGEE